MLIVNNSLPKCGGVWLHSILCNMIPHERPDERWRQPGWESVSPAQDRLPEFLASEDWSKKTVMFKAHYGPPVRLFERPHIRMVCAVRNEEDAVISRYHHLLRQGLDTPRDVWLRSEGVRLIGGLRKLRTEWARVAHIVEYEDLLSDAPGEIFTIAAYLGALVTWEQAEHIAEKTSADAMRARIGGHVRKARTGTASEELPTDILAMLRAA